MIRTVKDYNYLGFSIYLVIIEEFFIFFLFLGVDEDSVRVFRGRIFQIVSCEDFGNCSG